MCTGFIFKGRDIIFGFNMDLPDGAWDFRVYPRKDMFFVGIRANGRLWKTHGVNANGQFADMPYMNAPECGAYRRGKNFQRLDLLVNDYISGKTDFGYVRDTVSRRSVVNVPGCSMHTLFGDAEGRMLLVEPGFPPTEPEGNHTVISNFPILRKPEDLDPELDGWYGMDRYRTADEMLSRADASFGLEEGIQVLEAVSQGGPAPTRVSFVYSVNTRTVRWTRERNFAEPAEYRLVHGS